MSGSPPVKFEAGIPLMLRDGRITYVDVFRPDAPGKYPALLCRTPYDKSLAIVGEGVNPIAAAARGYVAVIQDVRGCFTSEGEFYPFVNEIDDGYDSVEWVAGQPWCNGKVGMWGTSYLGATQWLAAKAKPPSLVAIAPGVTASDYHEGWTWQGGAFELGFNLTWIYPALTANNWENLSGRLHLPEGKLSEVIDARDNLASKLEYLPLNDLPDLQGGLAPYYYDWLAHPEYDDYWKQVCIEESHSEITVPALNYGGWYDIFLGGTIRNYVGMRRSGGTEEARRGQRLLIGPWVHAGVSTNGAGSVDFGMRAAGHPLDVPGRVLRYYDYWLKGEDNGVGDEKPVQIFVCTSSKQVGQKGSL